jgi:hypothetical protein
MELGLSVTLRRKNMPFNKIFIRLLKFVIFAVLSLEVSIKLEIIRLV